MASPVWQTGATTAGTTAASIAVNLPSGIVANDVIVVTLYKENTAAVTPPAGYTEKTGTGVPPVVGTQQGQYTFWHRAAGSESGTVTFSWTGSVYTAATADRISGCIASGDPTGGVAGANSNTSTTAQPAVSLAATNANSLLYHAAGNFTGGDSQTTAPTGFTEREDLTDVLANSTKGNTAGGATGSLSGTWNLAATGQTAVVLELLSTPSIRSSSTYGSTTSETSSTVTLPTGWQAGDLCYIGWELTATSGTVTAPSGWTEVVAQFHAAGVTNATHGVLKRVLQGGDTGPAITHTSGRFAAVAAAVQGADATTPEDVTPTTDDNTGVTAPSVRAPSITPASDACLLITWHAVRNGTNDVDTGFTPDASELEQAEATSHTTPGALSGAAIECAYLALGAASATGTKTATATGTNVTVLNMMGSAIAVRNAAAAVSGGGTPGAPYAFPQMRTEWIRGHAGGRVIRA